MQFTTASCDSGGSDWQGIGLWQWLKLFVLGTLKTYMGKQGDPKSGRQSQSQTVEVLGPHAYNSLLLTLPQVNQTGKGLVGQASKLVVLGIPQTSSGKQSIPGIPLFSFFYPYCS